MGAMSPCSMNAWMSHVHAIQWLNTIAAMTALMSCSEL